ncbi:MAG: TMEM175 family protein [Pseudomonadota bacterium]|nr:TMEM175 family protein [Pseudomonadota bacterium]
MSMDLMEDHARGIRDYNLERVIMLSDGVFAITLLTLELRAPAHLDISLAGVWAAMWRPFAAYLVSFAVIAIFWMSHRRIFSRLARADLVLTALNFLFLAMITLVPVVTNMIYAAGANGAALIFYLALMGAIGVANALVYGYAAFLAPGLMKATMPLRFRLVVLAIMVLAPVLTPAASMYAAQDGNQWIFALLAAAWAIALIARRMAGRRQASSA